MLLEVSEGFKQRYLEVALKTDAALLLSALNVLNEAEINYRQARNKRLHVELVLIKLCYLQQAIELVNDGEHLHKKKQLESVRPVAFKSITQVALKDKTTVVKTIQPPETNNLRPSSLESTKSNGHLKNGKATLIIEEEKLPRVKVIADDKPSTNAMPQTKTRLSGLEKIRQEVELENKRNNNVTKELNEEELYVTWGLYIDKLQKNKNHSGVSNFKSAKLKIIDNNCIEIITENNIQQKFIEAERAELIEHLQTHFNNRFLTYRVIIVENKNNDALQEKHLTTKEQYLKIIEEYPLVKQLKDRLGLQLDY